MKLLAMLFLAMASSASAAEFTYAKRTNANELIKELVAAGFAVDYVSAKADSTKIVLSDGELKDPGGVVSAHTYTDPQTTSATRMARIKALAWKLKNGTITAAERDELLLKFLVEALIDG